MSPSQAERSEATRSRLTAAGRELFAAHGFAGVSAEEIVAAASVSRGALHHHYGDKKGLFRSVFEQVEAELTDQVAQVAADLGDDLSVAGVLAAFLDLCEQPDVRRIALIEAPAVLGWAQWREIEARYGLGLLTALVSSSPVVTDEVPAPVLAQVVLSAVVEAALLIAHADDPVAARRQAEATLIALYGGLLG